MQTVVILNGAAAGDSAVTAASDIATAYFEAEGAQVTTFVLREMKISYCVGCFECWVKSPGVCKIPDENRTVTRAVIQADMVVYVSRVTFGGYASPLKRLVDHLIPLVMPFFRQYRGETHHKLRYERYPVMVGLGVLNASAPDVQESLFHRLVQDNATNFGTPGWAAVCWREGTTRTTQRARFSQTIQSIQREAIA